MCETTGSCSTSTQVRVTDFCLWCGSAIDPASKRWNTCSNGCHLAQQNWAAGVRLALREGKCRLLSLAKLAELIASATPVAPVHVPVPASAVAPVKETGRPAKRQSKAEKVEEQGRVMEDFVGMFSAE